MALRTHRFELDGGVPWRYDQDGHWRMAKILQDAYGKAVQEQFNSNRRRSLDV